MKFFKITILTWMTTLMVHNLYASVCLNMIVKNESQIIERCIESIKPLITYWVIVDTGSTDGTQDVIKKAMKDIPGELHERPWINFGHNRNEALNLAKGKADYLLFIDADETLTYTKDFKKQPLTKDFYYIQSEYNGTNYKRVQIVKDGLNWKWIGAVHEAIDSPEAKSSDTLVGVSNIIKTDGDRAKDPNRFLRDAELLEKALVEEPNNTRNLFYLAQSYRDAEVLDKSIDAYRKRIQLGGWPEEVYISLLQIPKLQEKNGIAEDSIISEGYKKALYFRPSRSETYYYLSNYYRRKGEYQRGYEIAALGLELKPSNDLLFVEHWIDDYGLLLEYSVTAYWTERYLESLLASKLILTCEGLPNNVKECVERNLFWIDQKLAEARKPIP